MKNPESPKYGFEKSVVILFILFVLAGTSDTLAYTDSTFIKEITYDYRMIHAEKGEDCTGTLSIFLSVPPEATRVVLCRTAKHDHNVNGHLFFGTKILYETDVTQISADNISWGTYFYVAITLSDGSAFRSPTYYTDDFISKEDLLLIKPQSALEDIRADSRPLKITDGHLSVENPEITHIELWDIQGRQVYSGPTDTDIPLHHIRSPFLIARYMLSGNIVTSKILIK